MPITVSIFDFDKVITKKSTFATNSLGFFNGALSQNCYLEGSIYAETHLKEGLAEYFKHDLHHLSAIAAFHNNPAFIAGVVARILDRELTLIPERTILSSTTPQTAIDYYTVEGSEVPLLISYIPVSDSEFELNLGAIQDRGKNDQIQFLRERLLHDTLITTDAIIYFYDASQRNITQAGRLKNVRPYLVHAFDEKFSTFRLTEQDFRQREERMLALHNRCRLIREGHAEHAAVPEHQVVPVVELSEETTVRRRQAKLARSLIVSLELWHSQKRIRNMTSNPAHAPVSSPFYIRVMSSPVVQKSMEALFIASALVLGFGILIAGLVGFSIWAGLTLSLMGGVAAWLLGSGMSSLSKEPSIPNHFCLI